MDSRAKQRLTGAVILVTLFVLLVPELLTGPKGGDTTNAPAEEGVRRYIIDLNAPGAAPPMSVSAPDPVVLPPVVQIPSSTAERATPGEAAQAESGNSTPQASAPIAVPAQGSFAIQLGSFSSQENAERLVRDMTARGFNAFVAPIASGGRELYRVRVGPTRDRASAEALASQLRRIGQTGSIVPIS